METALKAIRSFGTYLRLPSAARIEHHRDLLFRGFSDPGAQPVVPACMRWLAAAQDLSSTCDGGVARHFSLVAGWGASYPETTGYIIPTMLDVAERSGDGEFSHRARRMLDWLVSIQMPCGAFQGGTVTSSPVVPVTFNTGQILLGLAAGAREFGEPYVSSMHRAASWLVESQDSDGCWRRHPTPFAARGEKVYETHVAWGLYEAAAVGNERSYSAAATKNIVWALTKQEAKGWFRDCCLSDRLRTLTHTLGYVLRGVLEAYRHTQEARFLDAAQLTGSALAKGIDQNGYLPGRFDSNWSPAVSWVCLTGTSQIAACWLMLYRITKDERFLTAARAGNRFVRRTINFGSNVGTHGGVKGAFPVWGDYGAYEYLNWAAKFTIDANLLEADLAQG